MKYVIYLILPVLFASCVTSKGLTIKKASESTKQTEHSSTIDHSSWDILLKEHVDNNGLVDYKGFKSDIKKLNSYIDYLGNNQPKENWSYNELLAYYINVYNANTIKLIVDNYPVISIKDIKATISPFHKKFIKIGTDQFSLNDIEKGILQKMNEPRIHFAINCASFSCPKLMRDAFTARNVMTLMERASFKFINSENNVISSDSVKLSEIFKWYKNDFTNDSTSIIDYLNRYSKIPIDPNASISYIEYNWNLNEKP